MSINVEKILPELMAHVTPYLTPEKAAVFRAALRRGLFNTAELGWHGGWWQGHLTRPNRMGRVEHDAEASWKESDTRKALEVHHD